MNPDKSVHFRIGPERGACGARPPRVPIQRIDADPEETSCERCRETGEWIRAIAWTRWHRRSVEIEEAQNDTD